MIIVDNFCRYIEPSVFVNISRTVSIETLNELEFQANYSIKSVEKSGLQSFRHTKQLEYSIELSF